ncbi:hypothetical protein ECDEC6D_1619 [Escherichia coli DEC6D]|nr:hypothetical protein ECDEC6D_1619 [Escherichia coli DEC6D]
MYFSEFLNFYPYRWLELIKNPALNAYRVFLYQANSRVNR